MTLITATAAAYATLFLLKEATVWEHLKAVLKRDETIKEFAQQAWTCPVCLGWWITTPALYYGPLTYMAINGLLVAAAGVAPIQPR